MPLLLLGGLEIILRLSGYGYPTGFFEKIRGVEKEFLVNNENFIMRFFPPETARFHQSPTTLKLVAAADCQRLFFPPYSPRPQPHRASLGRLQDPPVPTPPHRHQPLPFYRQYVPMLLLIAIARCFEELW